MAIHEDNKIRQALDDGGSAFPFVETDPRCGTRVHGGMSLRIWFAGLAMQQLIHRREMVKGETYAKPELAAECFHYADAMLKHLDQEDR